jgi:glycine/D-amino acid oxidase-like deaminating enzyme
VATDQPDPNRSVWAAESAPPAPAPALAGPLVTDVAIVGGGFTGVSTAFHLRRANPGLGIALLEAGVLGQGASGRNGGQVLHWINGFEPETPEETRRVHAATGAGIDLAEDLAKRFAPPGTFRRRGALGVYTDPRRADAAAGEVEALRAAGIPAEYVPKSRLGIHGAEGAVRDPLAGRLDGFALLQALRPVLRAGGVGVYEGTRVLRVRTGAEIRLDTTGGEVRAKALVLATNGYTPALGFFRLGLLPVHSHVLATEPLEPGTWERIGWTEDFDGFTDDLDRIAYAARTRGGRLLLGGGGNAAYSYRFGSAPVASERSIARAVPFMQGVLARYFPGVRDARIEHRWSGTLGLTLDRICSIGVRGKHRNVYHALGYSGHGIALGLLAGRVIADLHAGNHEAWRDLPFYQKRLAPFPPEPLRWLGYQALTRLTGKSPRRRA